MAGCKLSFIGWPTVDGSCGSDIYISVPVGVCSQTNCREGCWDFIKFMLKDVDQQSPTGMPVYMPFLRSLIEQAKLEAPPGGIQITDEDEDRFFALLLEINNVALYDEVILDIIDEEAAMYFAGNKTAEEIASVVESRVNLYINEQYF